MTHPKKLSLARLPTPIQKLPKISKELGKEVYLWRDDLNGFVDSGNKVRKLEFHFADAIDQGCDWIITCGGPQSNHTRATTSLARQLGLGVTVFATIPPTGLDTTKPQTSNLLLNQIFGAEITFLKWEDYQKAGASYDSFFHKQAEALRSQGKKPYLIPLGGSNALGCFGYISAVEEMRATWAKTFPNTKEPTDLFCALGSGGTCAGLQIGIEAQNLATRLWGVAVLGTKPSQEITLKTLFRDASEKFALKYSGKLPEIVDGYVGEGYALASDEDLRFYMQLAKSEGVLLDPCYTGKAFRGMIAEIKKDPTRFGDRILFLHSGGVFGIFAYAEQFHRALSDT